MPWVVYLQFLDEQSLENSLKTALRFSQNIEREKNAYWADLRGPDTVFTVMSELKKGPAVMVLAPNKWLAKFLAVVYPCYPAQTKVGDFYLCQAQKEISGQLLHTVWFTSSIPPLDFYPSRQLADEIWQDWVKSSLWYDTPLEGLWFLAEEVIEKFKKLGFANLGQLLPLAEDFLSREAANPYLPFFLKGGDRLPELKTNYPENCLQVEQNLVDPESWQEANELQASNALRQLAEELTNQLAQRRQGCLKLKLAVSHKDKLGVGERDFSAPQYTFAAIYENLALLWKELKFPSYGDIAIKASELQAASYPQFSLFDGRVREIPRELSVVAARFPGVIQQGMPLTRRERMLTYWDPWRFNRKSMN